MSREQKSIARFVTWILRLFGLVMIKRVTHQEILRQASKGPSHFREMGNLRDWKVFYFFSYDYTLFENLRPKSKSQLGQDLLAIAVSQARTGGFFVEFGATNGVDLSNTFLLEKELGWTGILAEPGKIWSKGLRESRTAQISTKAVWSSTGESLSFLETTDPELSTLSGFADSDSHTRTGSSYQVETVSLLDLLRQGNAPSFIDFISIDTEGSEFAVLENFDFSQYRFGLMCIEHNFSKRRNAVVALLLKNGYEQIFPELSLWDDWFVPKSRVNFSARGEAG